MATAVCVLCARVRVEEKQIITALGDAGAVAMPAPPTGLPLPPVPASREVAALGAQTADATSDAALPGVFIDRIANRSVASALLTILRSAGVEVIDAGLAATGSRLDIAAALANAGLPRPKTLVAFSEATGVEASARVGFPATLLPTRPGSTTAWLLDHDTADAVIEHRIVLGTADEAIVLIQQGVQPQAEVSRVHVVDGKAIAYDDATPDETMRDLACRAAEAIGADVAAVELACVDGECVVWDVLPAADFRASTLLGEVTMGEAIAALAMKRAAGARTQWEGVQHVIALSA
jgi:hypothetical protein